VPPRQNARNLVALQVIGSVISLEQLIANPCYLATAETGHHRDPRIVRGSTLNPVVISCSLHVRLLGDLAEFAPGNAVLQKKTNHWQQQVARASNYVFLYVH
jgi:hypothetical protein